jgi:hypothetical protein
MGKAAGILLKKANAGWSKKWQDPKIRKNQGTLFPVTADSSCFK